MTSLNLLVGVAIILIAVVSGCMEPQAYSRINATIADRIITDFSLCECTISTTDNIAYDVNYNTDCVLMSPGKNVSFELHKESSCPAQNVVVRP